MTLADRWRVLSEGASIEDSVKTNLLGPQDQQPDMYKNNVENYIGTVKVPVGIAGPLRVRGTFITGEYYVPLATTEAALVASVSRGIRAITQAGGATTLFVDEGVSRAPVFVLGSLPALQVFASWLKEQTETFHTIIHGVSKRAKLLEMRFYIDGNQLHVKFDYSTENASGQNMVTFCTDALVKWIVKHSPVPVEDFSLEGGYSSDKKASFLSLQGVRGRKVVAEVTLSKELVQQTFHTTPKRMVNRRLRGCNSSLVMGTIGSTQHAANMLTALYIATGQDPACASESHVGLTRFSLTEEGDLYASTTLPNIMVATVGGGTGLPSQKACLNLIGLQGEHSARAFAELCAATVLAGELSIAGAFAAGEFANAHFSLSRGISMKQSKL